MSKPIVVLSLLVFLAAAVPASSPVFADWLIDSNGLLSNVTGTVLGEITPSTSSHRDVAPPGTGEPTKTFDLKNDAGQLQITEVNKNAQGKIIRTQEKTLERQEKLHVESEDGEPVAIDAAGTKELEIHDATLSARSRLPLKVGEKNEITVTLPNGKEKTIAIPDVALSHLVEKGILTATGSGEATASGLYILTAGHNGEPVYQTEAKVQKRFLGIFKVEFQHRVEVAAASDSASKTEVGDVVSSVSTETSFLKRLLERFSF